MRGAPISRVVLLVALSAVPATAQVPGATPQVDYGSEKVDLPRGETTEVKGTIPDLAGYWLVASQHNIPGGQGRVFSGLELYRISKDAKQHLQVNWIDLKLPAEVATKMKAAQAEQKSWTPDKDDVEAITAALKAEPPVLNPMRRGKHVVSDAKNFDRKVVDAQASKEAVFVVQSLFQPGSKPVYGQSFYVTKASQDKLSGTVTMGAVPTNVRGVPMPIGTRGVFEWIRLDLPITVVATVPATPTAAAKTKKKK